MRKLNSFSDFTSERNAFLLSRVRAAFASMEVVNMRNACEMAVADPAPRFWVNECRAATILRRIMLGKAMTGAMIPEKRNMYLLLLSKVKEMMERRPDEKFAQIVSDVVNSEAPCSFMSGERLRKVLYAERARMRKERRPL